MIRVESEPFYVGEYRHRIDGKNRVTIPSKWRFLGDEADIYVGWGHPRGVYSSLSTKEDRGISGKDKGDRGKRSARAADTPTAIRESPSVLGAIAREG